VESSSIPYNVNLIEKLYLVLLTLPLLLSFPHALFSLPATVRLDSFDSLCP
jgi:hypothetical protein